MFNTSPPMHHSSTAGNHGLHLHTSRGLRLWSSLSQVITVASTREPSMIQTKAPNREEEDQRSPSSHCVQTSAAKSRPQRMVITQDDLGHVVSNTAATTGAFLGHGLRPCRYQPKTRLGPAAAPIPAKHCSAAQSRLPHHKEYRLSALADSNATNFIPHHHHQQERYPALIPAVLTAKHTIELIGSYTARHVESGLTVDLTSRRNRSTTKGALTPLCRELLELGHDPNSNVHVIRKALDRDGQIPVFQRDRTLKAWAGVDCVESETRSLRIVKHRPFSGALEAFHWR